ncbi:MAG: hypothetical protein A2W23_09860 [Planctomycetes bacterium RBG_16_43_13]|nr:MAG: hypothetical protein A2W23_09860 [Planctomycetes bacterium RBG_16_43_13]
MSKLYGTMFVSIIALILLIGICISQEKGDTPAPDRSAQIQKLIKQLGVNNKDIRVSAMQDLIRLKAEEAIPEMKKLLKDEDSSICSNAILFLGVIGAKDTIPELKELLKDRSWQVRSSVVIALGELGAKDEIQKIKELLKDDNALVRDSAITTLGYLGAKEAIPEIKGLLKDENWHVRGNVVSVLGQLGVKEAIPEIKELLKNEKGTFDAYVRGWAGIALVELGAKDAVPKGIIKDIKLVLEMRMLVNVLSAYKEDARRAENALRQLGVSGEEIEETKNVRERSRIAANEQDAIGSLKQLVSHEATWRRNDEDGNAIKDYYTFDVAGLHYHTNMLGSKLQYIDIKLANADPSVTNWDANAKCKPANGYYFKAMVKDGDGANYNKDLAVRTVGPITAMETLAFNPDRYGFCAYPSVYGKTGKFTFIVNQAGVIYKKDNGGKNIDQWPSKEGEKPKDGWEKVE